MSRIPYQDYGWMVAEAITEAITHWPHKMRSCQSKGPIKAWCCDFHRRMEYTLDLTPPTCLGGHGKDPEY